MRRGTLGAKAEGMDRFAPSQRPTLTKADADSCSPGLRPM
jgi:hypothetical protein